MRLQRQQNLVFFHTPIELMILVHTFWALNDQAPAYSRDLQQPYVSSWSLRAFDQSVLVVSCSTFEKKNDTKIIPLNHHWLTRSLWLCLYQQRPYIPSACVFIIILFISAVLRTLLSINLGGSRCAVLYANNSTQVVRVGLYKESGKQVPDRSTHPGGSYVKSRSRWAEGPSSNLCLQHVILSNSTHAALIEASTM